MADVLEHLVWKVMFNYIPVDDLSLFVQELHWKGQWYGNFKHLINHLRMIMRGYENEETGRLVEEMNVMLREVTGRDLHMNHFIMLENENEEAREMLSFEIGDGRKDKILKIIEELCVIRFGSSVEGEDIVVGFHDEVETLLDQSIVEINQLSEEQMGEKLYRLLKGRRYLVVLDDIWDCMAWNDLQIYFPDDKVGSRVLFTSRDPDVSLHIGAATPAHVLRLRTTDESWDIFQKKVFRLGICPSDLKTVGREIVEKCEGLPLAIVIAEGLVKNQLSFTWWSEIARSLHSFMVRDPSQYMDTLALSYNHLPPHLRSCFLFVGVFPEDYDIPVTKLIWLWIAQGFIYQNGSRVLEDVAEDFLMELTKRSLLMTAKRRVDGHIKACRIHDLLRDLCLIKAEEESFSQEIYRHAHVPTSSSTITNMPHVTTHSGFCYPFDYGKALQEGALLLSEAYKSLRILDRVYSCGLISFLCNTT